MKRQLIIMALMGAILAPGAAAQKKNVLDIKESITDSNIVYPESFEKDTQKLLESWYMRNYTATDDRYKSSGDPGASDEVIKKRLAAMPCVIEMPYNQIVRSYIDRYTKLGRNQVAAILGLSNYYMPIFEQALEEAGLPLELKYLPVIESGLDPNAVSRHGATGLWQFMLGTAKGLGLEVNSLVDERRDPYQSSKKATGYLKDLYATYGDWSLAIAAYNCGPGTVNKALRRAGRENSKCDFWTIYNYLPAETRGYVPMFIAANYVMTYYPEHNISPVLPTKPLITDTVGVSERIHFNQISNVLDIPVDELRLLNPQFRADIIPGSGEKTYFLILPSQQVHAYLMSEPDIRKFEAEKYAQRIVVEPGDGPAESTVVEVETPFEDNSAADLALVQGAAELAERNLPAPSTSKPSQERTRTVTHTVKQGETITDIASKYNVTATQIKTWNHLRRAAVRPGQQLRITTTADVVEERNTSTRNQVASQQVDNSAAQQTQQTRQSAQASANKQQTAKQQTKKQQTKPQTTNHKIASGENLSKIASKYGVSVDELRKANNLKGDQIRAGDNLKIPAKSKSSSKKKSKKRR